MKLPSFARRGERGAGGYEWGKAPEGDKRKNIKLVCVGGVGSPVTSTPVNQAMNR
jgi:hypothetical protein